MAIEIYAYRWGQITQTGSGPAWSAPSSTYPIGSVSLPVGAESAARAGVAGTLALLQTSTGADMPDGAAIVGAELQVTVGELTPGASGVSTPTFLIESAKGGSFVDLYQSYRGLSSPMQTEAQDYTQTILRSNLEKLDGNYVYVPASQVGKTPNFVWYTRFRPTLAPFAANSTTVRVVFQAPAGNDYRILVENASTSEQYSVMGVHDGAYKTVDVPVPFAVAGSNDLFVRVYCPTNLSGAFYVNAVNLFLGAVPPAPGSLPATSTDADGDGVDEPLGVVYASDVEFTVGGTPLGDIGFDVPLGYGTFVFGGPSYTAGRSWSKSDLATLGYRFRCRDAASSPGFVGLTGVQAVMYVDTSGGGPPPTPSARPPLRPRRIPPYRNNRHGR